MRAELAVRFELLCELMGIMQRTGYTTSVDLSRATADALFEHCKIAKKYVPSKGRQTKVARKGLVPVGWLGREELHRWALGKEAVVRLQRALSRNDKIALYAIDTDHAEE